MAGYTRQSSFVDGDTITAAIFNDEFNQLLNAFNNSTGHKHDGTTAEGPVIALIGDSGSSPVNKVLIDTANSHIEFWIDVSSTSVQQMYIADGAILPVTDNDIDLGSSSLEFKDLYLDGTATIDILTVDESATIGTTLGVTGATTLSSTLAVTGAATLSSTLAVTGAATLSSTLAVTGTSTLTGNVTASGDVSVGGNLTVTGNTTISGNLTLGDADTDSISIGAEFASDLIPDVDGTYDLGSSSKEWQDLYIDGTANIDSLVLGSGSTVTAILDEDDLSSDSATSLATQQSIKAYVDAQVTAQDLDFQGDSGGALSIDLDSESLTIAGGTGIDTTGALNTLTVAIDSTVATLTDAQTLTNKTIDVDSNTVSNIEVDNFKASAIVLEAEGIGSNDNDTSLPTSAAVKDYVDTQLTAEDLDFQGDSGGALSIDLDSEVLTIAGGTGIDTSGSANTLTVAIDSTVATLTGTQVLTNKTIDAASNTLSNIANSSLTNSSVSYGGVSVALGGSDATPAFDLSDATAYPGDSSLVTVGALNSGSITSGFGSIDVGSSAITTTGTVTGNTLAGTLSTAAQPNITSVGTLTSLSISGDLTVSGTTTTINSTTVTVDDPIFTVGGDTAPASDDNKDRGIEFRWHNGTSAKVGFFGYDDSASVFTFIPDATNTSEVFSGSAGNVAFGNIAGTLTTAAQTNITSVGALNGGSITSGFGAIDNGSSNITTTGTVTYGSLSDGTITITAFADEDDMTSNSATLVPTQQSVKAYVDAQVATANELSELTDVNLTTPADASLLFYDTTTSKWIDNVVSGDITIADTGVATIQPNSVALGTDTTGDYVGTITAGTGLTSTGATSGEGIAHSLSVDAAQTQITSVGTLADLTVTGEITANGGIALGDNDKATFGASDDLEIYHDGSNSYIQDAGTGNLYIEGTNLILRAADDSRYLQAIDGVSGYTALYHPATDGVKLSTTGSGISVTGNIEVSGTVDGRDVASDGSKLDGIESGATADQTITGGTNIDVTGTGDVTINMATGGIGSGTYGSTADGTKIDTITVDAYGRVTAVATGTTGDINAVTAGNGLTNGGTSGSVTLNVGAGTGIDVAADTVSVDVSDFMSNGSNNRVLTATGTDAMNAEANLTFDGSSLNVAGTLFADDQFTISGNTSIDMIVTDATYAKIRQATSSVDVLELQSFGDVHVNLDYNNNSTGKNFDVSHNGESGAGTLLFRVSDSGNHSVVGNLDISGNLNNVTDIYVDDQIIHSGDTDTYIQFHAANQFRVVTGGTEMLEVNDTYVQLGANLNANNKQFINVEDISLNDRIEHDGDANTYIQFHAADQWRVVTGGTERLEVNNTNVTLSDTHLHVDNGTATSSNRIIGEFTGNSTDNLRIDLINSGNGTNARSAFTIENNVGSQAEFGMGASSHSNISNRQFMYNGGNGGINIQPGGGGNVNVLGNLVKNSGSFNIKHPKPELNDTHRLIHSFVESPEADNLYSGTVTLVDGTATVNLDTLARMSDGTWVNLNTDARVFTTNETGWDATKGTVSGNTLTITCQDATSTDTISFLIIARRIDEWVMHDENFDDDGRLIVEREAVGSEIGEPSAENRKKFVYDMNWDIVGPKEGYDINGNPIEE